MLTIIKEDVHRKSKSITFVQEKDLKSIKCTPMGLLIDLDHSCISFDLLDLYEKVNVVCLFLIKALVMDKIDSDEVISSVDLENEIRGLIVEYCK